MVLIVKRPWEFQQCIRIHQLLWIVLEPGKQFSLFFEFSWMWLWFFCSKFLVCMIRVSLHIYRGLKLGQIFAKKSMELMFVYLICNHIFLNLFDWKNLPNLEILVPLIAHELPAYLELVCFTKRLKKSNLCISYILN